jgi:hypothetical protein
MVKAEQIAKQNAANNPILIFSQFLIFSLHKSFTLAGPPPTPNSTMTTTADQKQPVEPASCNYAVAIEEINNGTGRDDDNNHAVIDVCQGIDGEDQHGSAATVAVRDGPVNSSDNVHSFPRSQLATQVENSSSSKRRRVSFDVVGIQNGSPADDNGNSTNDTESAEANAADPSGDEEMTMDPDTVVPRTNEMARSKTQIPILDLLSPKAVQTILEFVDMKPRELFRLVTTIKPFYNAILPRPDIVVKNAYVAGGNEQKVITEIIGYIEHKSIHMPCTMRLMRLVNAKLCERGDECFGFDLILNQPAPVNKKQSRPFGLCLCQECLKVMSVRQAKLHGWGFRAPKEFLTDGIMLKPGRYPYYWRLIRESFTERRTGERVGPILHGRHLSQLLATYPSSATSYPVDEAQKSADEAVKSEASRDILHSILKMFPDYEDTAKTIVEAYKGAHKLKVLRDREAEKECNHRRNKRLDNSKAMLETLTEWLSEIATEYDWFFTCVSDDRMTTACVLFLDFALCLTSCFFCLILDNIVLLRMDNTRNVLGGIR